MKLILRRAKIVDPSWNKEKKRFDIEIKNGIIERIAENIDINGHQVLESDDLHVSIGFFDIGTIVGEPGLEHREDLESITRAACAGGYTGIAPFPNTNPVIQSKSEIKFIINNTAERVVDFYPIGAISKNAKGEDITEFIDMVQHGAVAFSDGIQTIANAGLMLRALQYTKASGGVIINHPDMVSISETGQVHEGEVSVSLGLEGLPEMAELLGLQRDITLSEYAEGVLCAYNISTKSAINILKKAPQVSATVGYLNLLYTDEDLEEFNVNLKVKPPLREEKDRRALVKALINDEIDAITSGHQPLEEELKKKSFAFADFGAIGIETAFPAILSELKDLLEIGKMIEKFAHGPRKILNLDIPEIKEGAVANLCMFDPGIDWTYDEVKSKSKNSPFLNRSFLGKVLGVINNKKFVPNE
ncbi:dihydroorotase [Portibacter marinus]|uniref:dihydroorotase n=1 Tax=Portibacter marinus TaxID=2898660 RepID=UPI001F1682A5|nr:dihydroorotase [Portibacter marinus]